MALKRATLGFKLHTGWAALVAATQSHGRLEILLRRRIELLPPDGSVPRFVYHQAAELNLPDAAKLVERAELAIQATATTALAMILEELRVSGISIEAAGVATGSSRVPLDLAAILTAHRLIHSAEGVLFQEAIARACETRGLTVTLIRERDLWTKLGEATQAEIDGLRGRIGPPWGMDQKVATGAALASLANRIERS